jgi:NAD(P)-dependent dehydrogenase (short-subunit alcohol dehydrogenase family)
MRLKDRRLLVTGGGSGIGLATAQRFRREGARVAVLDCSPVSLERALRELPDALAIECDVSQEDSVTQAVTHAADRMGGIDGVANVAGVATRKRFDELTLQELQADIGVNLIGPFLISRAALPHLRAAGEGTIVNVASGVALRPVESRAAYCASKGGLVALSKAMAIELAPDNIRVNVVCPGIVETPLIGDTSHGPAFSPAQLERLKGRRVLQRFGQTGEIADAILFLTGPESSFMTASVMAVDGGGAMH